MGLARYALAFGLGYTLGRPDGRRHLTDLGQQAVELTKRPEVTRLRERGRDLAADSVRAARKKLPAASRAADSDGRPGGDRVRRSWRRPAAATSPASATGAGSAASPADPSEGPAPRTPSTT